MTILTKPSIVIKKADGTKSPLVVDEMEKGGCDEDKVTIYPPPPYRSAEKSSGALFCMVVIAFLVAMSGVTCGLMLYRQYLHSTTRRYQGFCSIPIDIKEQMRPDELYPYAREHRVMPLQWSSEPLQGYNPADDILNTLREQLDIDDRVEKIHVLDNGRTISFIHDFDENSTGIVDDERCFLMDLDPEVVLSPDFFLVGIEQDDKFDVSRIRSTLNAMLPAIQYMMQEAPLLATRCADKPTYRLQRTDGNTIRKRSVDGPPHDYIQFAGKHVQEIEIANLAAVLDYERARP